MYSTNLENLYKGQSDRVAKQQYKIKIQSLLEEWSLFLINTPAWIKEIIFSLTGICFWNNLSISLLKEKL